MNSMVVLYGYVYLIRNKLNNKIYIGQHRSNIIDYNYYGSGNIIVRAISKYGKDNFELNILTWASSREELNILERFYILLYNSTDKNIGYNIQIGGQGSYMHREYKPPKGKDSPCFRRKFTKEQCRNISNSQNKLIAEGKRWGCYGKIAITDDVITKFVNPDELNMYLNSGWRKGRLPVVPKNENSKNQITIRNSEV